jgi:hypothetical protein
LHVFARAQFVVTTAPPQAQHQRTQGQALHRPSLPERLLTRFSHTSYLLSGLTATTPLAVGGKACKTVRKLLKLHAPKYTEYSGCSPP